MKRILRFAAIIAFVTVAALLANRWRIQWQDAASRTTCKYNLKAIGIALHSYHDSNAHFPPAYSSSQPPHSWRVALLPWVDEQALFEKYSIGDAWNEGANSELLSMRPLVYACPEVLGSSQTSYQAAVSLRSPWPYDTPTRIRDFTDGTSNTLMLFDVHDPEVEWTQPKDLTLQQAVDAVKRGQEHSSGAERLGTQVLLADGSVRYISREINPEAMHAMLTPSGGQPLPAERMSKESLARASEEMLISDAAAFKELVESSQLPATQLSPGAGASLSDGNTFIFCPTMALAWKRYVGVIPQVTETVLGTELLNNPFSETDISASAIEITTTTAENSGPKVTCKLRKHLAFVSEFDAHQLPLTFFAAAGPHNVRAFGVTSHWTEWRAALAQIRVIDYRSPDDFVIAIGNLSGEDLVLAKIPRPATLESGITDISTRIRDSRLPPDARSVVVEEQVVIPVLELSVKADFEKELNHADQPLGSRVVSATQIIQFRLDERGAVVWSEAGVIGENGAYDYAPGTRTFIFDKPFLIMLRESPDKQPYFASWIGNTDLMIPHEPQ